MKRLKENKGITLVALIITIIVLMILAIVTIRSVNDGGLFVKADKASKSYQIEAEKEAIKLAVSEWKMKKYDNPTNQTFSQYMQERFNNMNGYNCEEVDATTVKITGPSKSQYTVKEDGTVDIIEPGIVLPKPTIGILPGQTAAIEVILVGGLEGKITFTSSDPSTITVTDAGIVEIAENPAGTQATITVSCDGHTATCKVYIADQGDFTYNYNNTNKTASVTGLSSDGQAKIANAVTTLSMPDIIIRNNEEYTITEITLVAFNNKTNLNLANLPSGTTSIGSSAFEKCTNLALTELSSGITTIGDRAFYNCSNLALTELPSGITGISEGAFSGCNNLALTKLPSNLTSIGSYAFNNCANITLTELPSGLTSISKMAFAGCTNLALTELPSGITDIPENAFSGCRNITLTKLPTNLTSIGNSAFAGCTNLALTELPSGLTSIGDNAFLQCTNITITELPNGLISLGRYAFSNCTSITNITLPSSLTTVGARIFNSCTSIQNVYVKELESAPEGWDANWYNNTSKIHWAQ